MRIVLARERGLGKSVLLKVLEELHSVPGPMCFEYSRTALDVGRTSADASLSWEQIFEACEQAREDLKIDGEDFYILLTGKRNEENWFSSPQPNGARNIFVHAADWEAYADCAIEHPVSFQVIENIFQALMFETLADGLPYFHEPAIGCINDMCSWKPDVTFKIRTADICTDCLRIVRDRGISDELVAQALGIFEEQRKAMLFRNQVSVSSATLMFPFPIAITKRKMSCATEPFRKFLMLIDHFDCLVRTSVITLGCIAMDERFAAFYQANGLQDRPSLGTWVEALRSLSRDEVANVPNFTKTIMDRISQVVRIAEEDSIVSLRNEYRGHGYCSSQSDSYRDLFVTHVETIQDVEKLLRPLYNQSRWYYTLIGRNSHSKGHEYSVKDLTGEHPDFAEVVIKSPDGSPYTEEVYVVTDHNSWHRLSPYAQYRTCPECRHPRVLICDGEKHLDPYVGHRVNLVNDD